MKARATISLCPLVRGSIDSLRKSLANDGERSTPKMHYIEDEARVLRKGDRAPWVYASLCALIHKTAVVYRMRSFVYMQAPQTYPCEEKMIATCLARSTIQTIMNSY